MEGVKFDTDKPRWGLLPLEQVEQVVEILTFGAKKYSDDNWKRVENARERYFDAMMRHIKDYRLAKELNNHKLKNDIESGKNHLAHVICNALFLMWFDEHDNDKIEDFFEETPYNPILDNEYVDPLNCKIDKDDGC